MKLFFLNILILILCNPLFSQDSLLNYLEIAAKNNPTVLQKYNEYQAALQKVPQVGSLPDPEVSLGIFLSPMELIGGQQVADIRLMQMFPWFGVLKNAKDEMSLMANAKYESFRDSKLQVFYDVQRSWIEMQKTQQLIRITEKNVEILRSLERLSLAKFKSASIGTGGFSSSGSSNSNFSTQNSTGSSQMNSMGSSQPSVATGLPKAMQSTSPMSSPSGGSAFVELYRIQIEIGELENNLESLKNQQSTNIVRFNSYLNRPLKSQVSLPDSLKTDTFDISVLAISDSILANNPMLGMQKYEQQSLDARQKMVSRMSYPMVGLGLNYSLINKSAMSTSSMNGSDMIMPMVTVTLPIYRKKYKAMQSETQMMKTASEYGYQAAENSLKTEYFEAMQQLKESQRRMKLYENQSLLTKKVFDLMVKSFSVSGSVLTEVLRLRQQLLDYETKKVEAIADYNTSIAWLKRLMAKY